MNDRTRQVGQFLKGAAQESAQRIQDSAQQTLRDHGDKEHRKGFTSAASISLREIQKKLDSLKEQMGRQSLTKADQLVYEQLDELKSEIEVAFDRYWRGTGVDWRPPKPIAKIDHRPGKSQ